MQTKKDWALILKSKHGIEQAMKYLKNGFKL
jgi:hypothetical protein